jgi:hypothetical protein
MIRPNAILVNVKDSDGKRWNVVYIRDENGTYSHTGSEYVPTTDFMNLDPFVNWLEVPVDKEWVHPVIAKKASDGGWLMRAFDTFNEARWNGKSISLEKLNELGVIFQCFDKLLDHYKSMTDDELLEELNIGRIDKWTKEELDLI